MADFEEFFEVFFRTCIERRSIIWNMELLCHLCRHIHTHIIAAGTLLSFFWRIFKSANPTKKILHIIGSLDVGNIFEFTHSDKCLVSLIMLLFWLNIRIIPEANHLIFISEIKNRHHCIWSTTDMNENLWLHSYWTIESIFQNILRNSF